MRHSVYNYGIKKAQEKYIIKSLNFSAINCIMKTRFDTDIKSGYCLDVYVRQAMQLHFVEWTISK